MPRGPRGPTGVAEHFPDFVQACESERSRESEAYWGLIFAVLKLDRTADRGRPFGAEVEADFDGLRVFDANGNQISTGYSYEEISAPTPEPGGFAACGLLLTALALAKYRLTS